MFTGQHPLASYIAGPQASPKGLRHGFGVACIERGFHDAIPLVRWESDIPPEPTRLRRSDEATALKGGVAVSRREIGAKRKPLNALGSGVAMLSHGSEG